MHSYDAMLKSYICDCMAKKHAEMFTIYKNWFKSSALMFSRIESLIYTRNKLLMLERWSMSVKLTLVWLLWHQTKKGQTGGKVISCGWIKESNFLGMHSW
jgi:hypothetical protein